jgi:C-terminal processing protease CtpA/Prc
VKADESDHYLPSISPDGKKIAWIQDRITLRVSDIDGGNAITLLDEDDLYTFRDGDQDFSWSPDSQWILFDFSKTLSNGEVLLLSADGKKRENLTNSGYRDWSPAFAEGGKQIIWMSNRYGMKNYATSSSTTYDVFALFLDKARWDDFQLSKEEKELQDELEKAQKEAEEKEDKDEKKKADKEKQTVEPLSIDWDGLEDRKARLTLNSARISSAVLSKDAEKLYYIANYDEDYSLWEVTLREKEAKKVMPIGAGQLVWGPEQKSLYLLSRGRISEVDVKGKSTKPIKIEAMMNLDKSAEMKVLFDHIWLRTSKIFYHSNFHGIDWSLMKQEYEPKVAHLGNEYEFTELISEMIGELNVSHAGARFRGSVVNARDETASLGLLYDWSYDGEGLGVAEVLKGGPMDKAAIDVKPGMILSAIDGEAIPRDTDWVALLNQKAGKRTLLTFTDEKGKALPNVVMKPVSLGQERSLLYKRWVEQNRKEVEERSEGTLGYVHIPGMSDEPYRSIYDDMLGSYAEQEGVIVDTRFNGGGDLVADLAMFFTGEPFLTYLTEKKVVGGEPTSRYTKATLALINEAQYSDGHCFASGYTDLGIGTTVGMPVPGTCSFAGWEGLSNGVVWGIVPVSAQNKAGEWLENNQTEPDVRVKNMPAVISKGRDQQLEKAVEVLLEQVK